ncbi:hypothetical protein EV368DRAFT_83275 [Lentinula lateritia]|nr:hypothetical protein EV368DRAFT_83275 [Lentinula lateritia]
MTTQITGGWNSLPDNITFLRQCMQYYDSHLRNMPIQLQRYNALKVQCEALFRGSGFRKLPLELVLEIFVHCLEPASWSYADASHRMYTRYTQYSDIPFVLSQVCRQWRIVALSTPALWTCLSVDISHLNDAGTVHPDLINCCLERSRLLPLHIALTASNRGDEETGRQDPQNTSRTINRLIPECFRWESFELMIHSCLDVSTPSLQPIPPTGAPTLRSIQFCNWSGRFSSLAAWISDLMRSSPNLRNIRLNSAEGIQFADISWVHLQNFEVWETIKLKDLFILFENCPELRTCTACLISPVHLDVVSSPEIVLNHLHTLILTYTQESDLEAAFCWLTLPALKKLILSGFCNTEWPDESFSNFLSRSGFSLEVLSLKDLAFTDAHLVSYLHHSSIHDSLEKLVIELEEEIISSFLLDFLTFKLPSSDTNTMHAPLPLLPKLNSFLFTVNAITQAVALRHFVASRWYDTATYEVPLPVASLKHIHVRLVVPDLPNVNVSIDEIEHVFSRITKSRGTEVRLETIAMAPSDSDQYAGIERLNIDSVFEGII